MTASLPLSPSLEHLRRQARDLLKAARAGDPAALERIRRSHPVAPESSAFKLSDAQWVLAREYGFPSWPRLKAYVERLAGNGVFRPFRTDLAYFQDRAQGFLSLCQAGLPEAYALLRRHHPGFQSASEADLAKAEVGEADARLVLAREHGFPTWERFRRHLQALEKGETAEPFMAAFRALEARDLEALRGLLDRHPDLIHARGTNGNSLINLALGVVMSPDHSRPPELAGEPVDARTLLQLLLERGADVNAPNNRGWTAMHQAGYCGSAELVRALLEAGGRVDPSAHGEGGTPLAQALFWGHREAAELLAERGVVPLNLRIAAALGRVDLLPGFFHPDGALKPEAGAHRAFYRPHSGFPVWQQKGDRQEILDEALVWAANNGRTGAMQFLLERGADINGCPYRGTPLIAAAGRGDTATVRWLLDHGAEVNRRTVYGGTQHGQDVVALHPAAQYGHTETCRLLLERGADPNVPDGLYFSPPFGWAAHFGATETREVILEVAWPHSLFAAVATGSPDRVRDTLSRHPEQVNDTRFWGTPLVLAVMKRSAELVQILLTAGAEPGLPGKDGTTPLTVIDPEDEAIRTLLTAAGDR